MDGEKGFFGKVCAFISLIAGICAIIGFSFLGDFTFADLKKVFANEATESSQEYKNTEVSSDVETKVPSTDKETISEIETTSEAETILRAETTLESETNNLPSKGNSEEEKKTPIQTQQPTESNRPIEPTYSPTYTPGWVQDKTGNWKWRLEDGSFLGNGILLDNGNTYYFVNGLMVTGWKQISGDWYYFNDSGSMQKKVWVEDYYLQNDGKMAIGWLEIEPDWYYFDESGIMQKNTWVDNYYLRSDGIMLKNTEATIDNIAYKFDNNGLATRADNPNNDLPTSGALSDDESDSDNKDEDRKDSTLSFSDNFGITRTDAESIRLEGTIVSNYVITLITYEVYTPDGEYYCDDIYVEEDKSYSFYLVKLNNILNDIIFEREQEYLGGYDIFIAATDSSGATVSKSILWYKNS